MNRAVHVLLCVMVSSAGLPLVRTEAAASASAILVPRVVGDWWQAAGDPDLSRLSYPEGIRPWRIILANALIRSGWPLQCKAREQASIRFPWGLSPVLGRGWDIWLGQAV